MGTRNITAVVLDGEYRVAQYGQWDGYPDSAGVKILEFCQSVLAKKSGRKAFAEKVSRATFLSADECDKQRNAPTARFHRDTGSKILAEVWKSEEGLLLYNDINFVGDSLMCEWAYVVDLDKKTFEVFKGFNKTPLADGERFATIPLDESAVKIGPYYQVRHVKTYSLKCLPKKKVFLDDFGCEDEE